MASAAASSATSSASAAITIVTHLSDQLHGDDGEELWMKPLYVDDDASRPRVTITVDNERQRLYILDAVNVIIRVCDLKAALIAMSTSAVSSSDSKETMATSGSIISPYFVGCGADRTIVTLQDELYSARNNGTSLFHQAPAVIAAATTEMNMLQPQLVDLGQNISYMQVHEPSGDLFALDRDRIVRIHAGDAIIASSTSSDASSPRITWPVDGHKRAISRVHVTRVPKDINFRSAAGSLTAFCMNDKLQSFVAHSNGIIHRVAPKGGTLNKLSGLANAFTHVDGDAKVARFVRPHHMTCDTRTGMVYILDGSTVRQCHPSNGHITTLCGRPPLPSGRTSVNDLKMSDGEGEEVLFRYPQSIVWVPPQSGSVYAPGALYVLDCNVIRRVDFWFDDIVREMQRSLHRTLVADGHIKETPSFAGWPLQMIELVAAYLPAEQLRVTTLLLSSAQYSYPVNESHGCSLQLIRPTSLSYWSHGDALLIVDSSWPDHDTLIPATIISAEAMALYATCRREVMASPDRKWHHDPVAWTEMMIANRTKSIHTTYHKRCYPSIVESVPRLVIHPNGSAFMVPQPSLTDRCIRQIPLQRVRNIVTVDHPADVTTNTHGQTLVNMVNERYLYWEIPHQYPAGYTPM